MKLSFAFTFIRKLVLVSILIAFSLLKLNGQLASPGYILDSTAYYWTYVIQVGTNDRGRPVYEQMFAPYHGIKHTYNSFSKPEVDIYHRYDFGESEEWFRESTRYYTYNSNSLLIEEVRLKEDSIGTELYELETFQYDDLGNMTQRTWYRPPLGSECIDTTVQDWDYVNVYKYTYDDKGNVMTRLDSLNREFDTWYEYSYNDASMVTSIATTNRYSYVAGWEPNWSKTDYVYENDTKLLEIVSRNLVNGEWVNGDRKEYRYYPNDSIQYEIIYLWKDTVWISLDTLEHAYEYNDLDQIISFNKGAELYLFTYHLNGQTDSIKYYGFYTNNFTVSKYDTMGNQVLYMRLGQDLKSITNKIEYFYREISLGTEQLEYEPTYVFPNPATFEVRLTGNHFGLGQGPAEISIYDIRGQLVQSELLGDPENSVDVSRLRTGLYFINVRFSGKIVSTKFFKE